MSQFGWIDNSFRFPSIFLAGTKKWGRTCASPQGKAKPTKTMTTTAIIANGARINITEGRTIRTEESEIIRMFHANYEASGAEYCELGVYEDGSIHSSVSKHSDETAARLCDALARRLGLNK